MKSFGKGQKHKPLKTEQEIQEEIEFQKKVNEAMKINNNKRRSKLLEEELKSLIKWDDIITLLDDSFLEMFSDLFNFKKNSSNNNNNSVNCQVSYEDIINANIKLQELCMKINNKFIEIFHENNMAFFFSLQLDGQPRQPVSLFFFKNFYFFNIKKKSKYFSLHSLNNIEEVLRELEITEKFSIEYLDDFFKNAQFIQIFEENKFIDDNFLAIILAVKVANKIFEDFAKNYDKNYNELRLFGNGRFDDIPTEIICGYLYLNHNDFDLTKSCLDSLLESEDFQKDLQTLRNKIEKNSKRTSNINKAINAAQSFNDQVGHTALHFNSSDLFHHLQEYDNETFLKKMYRKGRNFISFSDLFSSEDIYDLHESIQYLNSISINYDEDVDLVGIQKFLGEDDDLDVLKQNYIRYKILEFIYTYRHGGSFSSIEVMTSISLATLFNENNRKNNLFIKILCCYTDYEQNENYMNENEVKQIGLDDFLIYYCCLIIGFVTKKTLELVLRDNRVFDENLFRSFTRIIIDSQIYLNDNKPEEEYYILMGYKRRIPFKSSREYKNGSDPRFVTAERLPGSAAALAAAAKAAAAADARKEAASAAAAETENRFKFHEKNERYVVQQPNNPPRKTGQFDKKLKLSINNVPVFESTSKQMTPKVLYDHITNIFTHMKNIYLKDINSYLNFLFDSQDYINLKDNETYKKLFDELIMKMHLISLELQKNKVNWENLSKIILELITIFELFSKLFLVSLSKFNKKSDIEGLFKEIVENLKKQNELIKKGDYRTFNYGKEIEKYLEILELNVSDLYENAVKTISDQYKKLAFKYHPNKQSNKSQANKDYAGIKFPLLNEANEWLGDNIQLVLKYIHFKKVEKNQEEITKKSLSQSLSKSSSQSLLQRSSKISSQSLLQSLLQRSSQSLPQNISKSSPQIKIIRQEISEINRSVNTSTLSDELIPLLNTEMDPYKILELYQTTKSIQERIAYFSKQLNKNPLSNLSHIEKLAYRLLRCIYNDNYHDRFDDNLIKFLLYFSKEKNVKNIAKNILNNIVTGAVKKSENKVKNVKNTEKTEEKLSLYERIITMLNTNKINIADVIRMFTDNDFSSLQKLFLPFTKLYDRNFKEVAVDSLNRNPRFILLVESDNAIELRAIILSQQTKSKYDEYIQLCDNVEMFIKYLFYNEDLQISGAFKEKDEHIKKSIILYNFFIKLANILEIISTSFSNRSNSTPLVKFRQVIVEIIQKIQKLGLKYLKKLFNNKSDRLTPQYSHNFKQTVGTVKKSVESNIKNELKTDLESVLTDIEKPNNPNNPRNAHNIMSNVVTGAKKKYAEKIGMSMSNEEQKFDELNKRMGKFKRKLLKKYKVVYSSDNLECFKQRIISKFRLDPVVVDKCVTEEEIRKLVIRTINDESKLTKMFIDYFVFFILCYDADIKSRISNTKKSKEKLNVLQTTEVKQLLNKSTAQKEFEKKLFRVGLSIKNDTERMLPLIANAEKKGDVRNAQMFKDVLNGRTKTAIAALLKNSTQQLPKNNRLVLIKNSLKTVNPELSNKLSEVLTIMNRRQKTKALIANATNEKKPEEEIVRLQGELNSSTKSANNALRNLLFKKPAASSVKAPAPPAPAPPVRALKPSALPFIPKSETEFFERGPSMLKNEKNERFISEKTAKSQKKKAALVAAKEAANKAANKAKRDAEANWDDPNLNLGLKIPNNNE